MSQIPTVAEASGTQTTESETPMRAPAPCILTVQSCGMTDQGRVRSSNEDQFLIADLAKALRVQQTSLPLPPVHYSREHGHLFLVADGMGGHAGGERASALAVNAIENFMLNSLKWFFHLKGSESDEALKEFQNALSQADDRLFHEAAKHPELHGMGTTLTMAYSIDADLFVVHAGDSRCYLFRSNKLYRLTRDHTVVAEMLRLGYLEPEQAANHQLRHVITNVIGGTKPGVQVEVHKVKLEPQDFLLLCSDGLTEMVTEEEIATTLASATDPQVICRRLVERANEQGGKDNVTVILVRYEAKA